MLFVLYALADEAFHHRRAIECECVLCVGDGFALVPDLSAYAQEREGDLMLRADGVALRGVWVAAPMPVLVQPDIPDGGGFFIGFWMSGGWGWGGGVLGFLGFGLGEEGAAGAVGEGDGGGVGVGGGGGVLEEVDDVGAEG